MTVPVASPSDGKPLNRPLPGDGLPVTARHHGAPECGGRVVAMQLPHLPGTRKQGEHLPRGRAAGTSPAVLPHDEELGHVVHGASSDERETCPPVRSPNQERPAAWIGPVVIKVRVSKLAVLVDIVPVPLRELAVYRLPVPGYV